MAHRLHKQKLEQMVVGTGGLLVTLSAVHTALGPGSRLVLAVLGVAVALAALLRLVRPRGVLVFNVSPHQWRCVGGIYQHVLKRRQLAGRHHVRVTMRLPDGHDHEVSAHLQRTAAGNIELYSGTAAKVTVYLS